MIENNAAAEQVNNTDNAEGQSVENNDEKVELTKAELDELIQTAQEATALAQKKTEDAENYKKGMLKYKGKLDEYGYEDEEQVSGLSEERVAQIVTQTLQPILEQLAPKQNNDELAKANAKIEEMKIAINNRQQVRSVSGGSNVEKTEVKASPADKYFSPDQLAELKRAYPNLDPNEILKNMPEGGQAGFANGPKNA